MLKRLGVLGVAFVPLGGDLLGELRITLGDSALRAILVPPDREVYWQLNSNVEELKSRLVERGLSVEEVQVADP